MPAVTYSKVHWDQQGLPKSIQFDDHYFCAQDGLAEAQHVFCDGNDLKSRWQQLPSGQPGTFTIAEAGFGTGLNFLCTLELWQESAPANWTLNYISIEKYPLNEEDLKKAHQLWPSLSEPALLLQKQYYQLMAEPDIVQFAKGKVHLHIITKEIMTALKQMNKSDIKVDAWYLDGFAPAKNPEMWRNEVFALMRPLSQDGTTVSTFTSAGFVRRGLTQNGFKTQRAEGFGSKRHMLKGVYSA